MGLFRKQGGGFLNGVNGRIESVKFDSKEFDGAKGPYHKLSAELVIAQDGAEETVQQFLDAGFIYPDRDEAVSGDGSTLEGGAQVNPDSEFGLLVKSFITNGNIAETEFPEDGSNFDLLTTYRVTFGKELNKDRQMAAGRKKLGIKDSKGFSAKGKEYSEQEILDAGKRQDQKDKKKFYNHDRLVVTAVLGGADAKPTKAGKVNASKPNGKAQAEEADYTEQADEMLLSLLEASKDGVIKVSSLGSLVVKKSLEDDIEDEVSEGIRGLFADTEYREREAGWTYDVDAKTLSVKRGKKR